MQRVETALQFLQDDPALLDLHRHRFSESPPPYESPPTTEPPSPLDLPAQRSAYEKDELFRQPFNNRELYLIRTLFQGYHAGNRYNEEIADERQRIRNAYFAINLENRCQTYRGPELEGRAGGERYSVMIRNGIRKRWQRLGVWNSAWGIPGRVNTEVNDEWGNWSWEWAESNLFTLRPELSIEQQSAEWPRKDEETATERVLRRFIQDNKRWSEQVTIPQEGSEPDDEVDVDPREHFLVSRPWFRFKLEVSEEARRLERVQRSGMFETATINARNRWKQNGRWKDTWNNAPGWKWPNESPSPEPEDPNDLDFSPSEIDALDAIRPATPPKPLPKISGIVPSLFGSTPTSHECTKTTQDANDAGNHDRVPQNVKQSSTKRKRQEERSRHEGNDQLVNSKRVKLNSADSISGPTKRQSKQHQTSRSLRPRSSDKSEDCMGTLWRNITPSTTRGATPRSRSRRSGAPVKLRRSARLADQDQKSYTSKSVYNKKPK